MESTARISLHGTAVVASLERKAGGHDADQKERDCDRLPYQTKDMPSVTREADIVIVAAGRAGVVDESYVAPGQIVIDVGINVNEEGKLCGDVKYDTVEPVVDAITPVPAGWEQSPLLCLWDMLVEAAMRKAEA